MLTPQLVLSPQIGEFLRPVGRIPAFSYSLRVVRHWEAESPLDHVRTACQRWGLKDGHAFDDGHVSTQGQHIVLIGLQQVTANAWREGKVPFNNLEPVYWVLADGPDAQRDLFGDYQERRAVA